MGLVTSLILPALPGIITLVEKLFNAPKSGETKLGVVTSTVRVMLNALTTSGQIQPADGTLTDDRLQGMIEAKLAEMRSNNTLVVSAPVAVGQMFLLQGSVTLLSPAIK